MSFGPKRVTESLVTEAGLKESKPERKFIEIFGLIYFFLELY